MTVKELNVGDTFRVAGETSLWRKISVEHARVIDADKKIVLRVAPATVGSFRDKEIEVVERTADIRRSGNLLFLRGGEVVLEFEGAWGIYRCTPGDPLTEFVLTKDTFMASVIPVPTAETALGFKISVGSQHLGRPPGGEVIAYGGRLYARATKREVLGKATSAGGYKRILVIDGAKRVVIAGTLTIPSEFALYDIIMEHFGPDTVTQE